MNFNFRKISAIGASAIMVGMTMGVAAAASFPSPFSGQSSTGVAVVSGSGSGVDDTVATNDISAYLATKLTSGGTSTVSGGDSVKFEKSTNLFNLGDSLTSFFTKLDEDELTTVLAKGKFTNDANADFEYEQEISLATGTTLTHFLSTNDDFSSVDVPVIGFNFEGTTDKAILNYTLKFTPDEAEAGGDWIAGNDLETRDIMLLGRTYYVLQARNTSATNAKLTLLDTANSITLTEGETATVAGKQVSVDTLLQTKVVLNIDGEDTNVLEEGATYKLTDGSYVAIKNLLYNAKESGISKVEFSIGSGKIEIENNVEVQFNDVDTSDLEGSNSILTGLITKTGNDLKEVTLEWKLDDDEWMIPGEDLVMPGFGTIKLSMGGFNVPAEEVSKVEAFSGIDGSARLTTSTEDGSVNLDLLYINATGTGFGGLGESATRKLVTTNATNTIQVSLNETENSYFVATWISGQTAESYAFELQKIDEDASGNNVTTLKNLADSTKDITLDSVADDESRGEVTFTLHEATDSTKIAVVNLTRTSGSGALYADRLVSKEGLRFLLPKNNGPTATANVDGHFNLTAATAGVGAATWVLNVTEEDKDGNVASGGQFNSTIGIDTEDGASVTALAGVTTLRETKDSDNYLGYVVSDLATMVNWYKPSGDAKSLTIKYPGEESSADVYLAESTASISGIAAGSIVFKDNEKSSWSNRHVVLVGGSCINSATAEVLGVSSGTCEADFTSATGVGSGEYMIKSVGDAFTSGKTALVVAGYEKADTQAAVSKLVNDPSAVDTTSGKEYRGKTGVQGTLAFTEA